MFCFSMVLSFHLLLTSLYRLPLPLRGNIIFWLYIWFIHRPRKIDNCGGGGTYSLNFTSFEIDSFYGLWTWICAPPPQLSIFPSAYEFIYVHVIHMKCSFFEFFKTWLQFSSRLQCKSVTTHLRQGRRDRIAVYLDDSYDHMETRLLVYIVVFVVSVS